MTKKAIISVKNLVKNFGDHRVLKGISLDIYEGETLVVMGGSGCGKSTFLRLLIGSLKPDEGEVSMFGLDIAKISGEEMDKIRRKFGMLFQSAALFDSMTVGENIGLPLREHAHLDESIIQIIIKLKLDMVGLRGFEDLMPSELSGGMRKRVGLARAIVMDPKIVFYDEPTAGLDPVMTGVIDKLTVDLTQRLNITSVIVTHDMGSVFRIASRIVMLHEGSILEVGTPNEIRNSKNPIVRQFIEGNPEGPISFVQERGSQLESLTSTQKQ